MRLAIPLLGISGIELVDSVPDGGSPLFSIIKLVLQLGIGVVSYLTFTKRSKTEIQKTNELERLQNELDELKKSK